MEVSGYHLSLVERLLNWIDRLLEQLRVARWFRHHHEFEIRFISGKIVVNKIKEY